MKTTFAFLASIVVLMCAFNVLRTEALDGATASFTNQTFSENGTNLIGTFEFTKDFAADSLQCNFTFPGDKTFFKVMDRYLISYNQQRPNFTLKSDISVRRFFFLASFFHRFIFLGPLFLISIYFYLLGN